MPTSRWMSMSEGSNSFKFLTSKAGKKGFPTNYSFCFLAGPPSRHHYRWSSATSTTITAILFLSPPFNISVTFSPPPHVIQIILNHTKNLCLCLYPTLHHLILLFKAGFLLLKFVIILHVLTLNSRDVWPTDHSDNYEHECPNSISSFLSTFLKNKNKSCWPKEQWSDCTPAPPLLNLNH